MTRIHCSLHKCLTTYVIRVMSALYNRFRPAQPRYRHYASLQDAFYASLDRHRVISANNFAVDLRRIPGDFRLVRFVRDPRDLVVSGYFYHRGGREPWFRTVTPTEEYWSPINGHVPAAMPPGVSYARYLELLPKEQGLLAEIEFRRHHFQSLREWRSDERIRVYKYEDIVANERAIFEDIFSFYELPWYERRAAVWLAGHYAADRRKGDGHVRDPRPRQWLQHFTPAVHAAFEAEHGDLLDLLGYRS